jgi:RNA polymerase sigma factor (TIGR02999 family)
MTMACIRLRREQAMTNLSYDRSEVTRVLAELENGDDAAMGRLLELVYDDLKRMAHARLVREAPGHTLSTTALVNEAFLRIAAGDGRYCDRSHFFRTVSRVMRHLLVDHARRRNATKRGGIQAPATLDERNYAAADDDLAILALDQALKQLVEIDPQLERIVECRFFAGLTVNETAEALGMAVRTVEREWQRARGYLLDAMEGEAR